MKDNNFFKDCIYIGKKQTKTLAGRQFYTGYGILDFSTISFGMTGGAFYDRDKRKWDFRPDGLNIAHFVSKKDLYFYD